MLSFRCCSPFRNRPSALHLFLAVVFLIILTYLFKDTILQSLTLDDGTARTDNRIERRINNQVHLDHFRPEYLIHQLRGYKNFYAHLLNQARQNIKQRLKFNTLDVPVRSGNKIPMKHVRRILIVSSYRSGSSFFGDLLKSYQGVFYSYEPLKLYMNDSHLERGKDVEKCLTLIKDISTCNFTAHRNYITHLSDNNFIMKANSDYWQICNINPAFCYDPNFISDICQYLPVNVVKTVRLGLNPVKLLLDDQRLNFKVVHLVRDPRGSLNSRHKMNWCSSDLCSNPKTVCKNLLYDLSISAELLKKYRSRYLLVRYEDLSMNTEKTAKGIFSFLGLTFHDSIRSFIDTHTKGNSEFNESDPYTTYRNSHKTAFAWRETLSYDSINSIQIHCQKSLEVLGYRYFENEDQYKNVSLSVVTGPTMIQ